MNHAQGFLIQAKAGELLSSQEELHLVLVPTNNQETLPRNNQVQGILLRGLGEKRTGNVTRC